MKVLKKRTPSERTTCCKIGLDVIQRYINLFVDVMNFFFYKIKDRIERNFRPASSGTGSCFSSDEGIKEQVNARSRHDIACQKLFLCFSLITFFHYWKLISNIKLADNPQVSERTLCIS